MDATSSSQSEKSREEIAAEALVQASHIAMSSLGPAPQAPGQFTVKAGEMAEFAPAAPDMRTMAPQYPVQMMPPPGYILMPAAGVSTPSVNVAPQPFQAQQLMLPQDNPGFSAAPIYTEQAQPVSLAGPPVFPNPGATGKALDPTVVASPGVPRPMAHPVPLGFQMGTGSMAGNSAQGLPEIDMTIAREPPIEVRTRTPSENRTFSTVVQVRGPLQQCGVEYVKVGLVYHTRGGGHEVVANQSILGGTKLVAINSQGQAPFSNLSISEASTKHREHEFALEYVLVCRAPSDQLFETTVALFSNPFYAYSHKKVLTRRKVIKIQTASPHFGPYTGGTQMHITGTPFIGGPSLTCIFRTPHGDVAPQDVQLYSESVVFFVLPPYPVDRMDNLDNPPQAIKAIVQVSNNGRHFSNPLDFYYIFKDAPPPVLPPP